MSADLKALLLQINIQEKNIQELQSRITGADIKASRRGVITWVSDKIGSSVNAGSELVRIADLSSFKVEGSIADAYANKIKSGTEVKIRINNTDLSGKVATVNPSAENGIIHFTITLDEKASPLLRPYLKTEVFLITSFKKKAIIVKNSAAFDGSAEQNVFVIKEGKAIRRRVTVGESNFDHVEILTGLAPGEEIISSDMSEYKHLEALDLK
jgi:HlyD family secretion protein